MPGYMIHLTEAEMVYNRLHNSTAWNPNMEAPLWKQTFLLGALYPDAISRSEKYATHFWREKGWGRRWNVPDLKQFLKQYPNWSQEPLLFGCLVHLHLDYCYFQEFFPGFVEEDEHNDPQERDPEKLYMILCKTGERMTKAKLFSKEGIYGDYSRWNTYLQEAYHPEIPKLQDVNLSLFAQGNPDKLQEILKIIPVYLEESLHSSGPMKVFSEEELEMFISETAHRFIQELFPGEAL